MYLRAKDVGGAFEAEVDRYKFDLQLRHTQDYKPYRVDKEEANRERGGTGGPQKEEETD